MEKKNHYVHNLIIQDYVVAIWLKYFCTYYVMFSLQHLYAGMLSY